MKAKRFLSLILSLTLAVSLTAPAYAAEVSPEEIQAISAKYDLEPPMEDAVFSATENTDLPLWQAYGFLSLEHMLDARLITLEEYEREAREAAEEAAWKEAYWAEHGEEMDADALFQREWGEWYTKAEYMRWWDLKTEEDFRDSLKDQWLNEEYWRYQERERVEAWSAEHPEEAAAFDPDHYFDTVYNTGYWDSKEAYMAAEPVTPEEEFRGEMLYYMIALEDEARERQEIIDAFAAAYPQELADFDPDAWFRTQYGDYWTKEEFMDNYGLETEEDFRQFLTAEWVGLRNTVHLTAERTAQWSAEHPEEAAGFDPDAWFRREYFWDKEEYLAGNYQGIQTLEELDQAMLMEYIQAWWYAKGDAEAWAALLTGEPEDTAAFLADVDRWFSSGDYAEDHYYPYPESLIDYMMYEDLALPEQAYLILYPEWLAYRDAQAEAKAARDAHKIELGGVPGELSVMVNGTYLSFPDAKPLARENRTMIPVRALAEALGYTVEYDPETLSALCVRGEDKAIFTLGETALSYTLDGTDDQVYTEAAPFAEDGRIYVPLRALVEALGCQVAWDAGYDTAVVFDPAAIAGEIDRNFTQVDRMLSTLAGKALDTLRRNTRTTGHADYRVTLFNSLDGDRTYTIGLDSTVSIGAGAMEGQLKVDMIRALAQLTAEDWAALQELMDLADMEWDLGKLRTLLGSATVNYLWNSEGLYLQSPLFSLVNESVGAEDWIQMDLPMPDLEQLSAAALPNGEASKEGEVESLGLLEIGSWLYDSKIARPLNWSWRADTVGVDSYAQLMEQAEALAQVIGDQRFARAGDKLTYTLDTGDVNQLIQSLSDDPSGSLAEMDLFRACRAVLAVWDNGDWDVEAEVRPGGALGIFVDFLLTVDGQSKGGRQTARTQFHLKNQFDLTVEATSQTQALSAPPAAQLPEGANVIPSWALTDYPLSFTDEI